MNQVLHIFRKDTRRFWLEILLSLAALTIYVVHYPASWWQPGLRVPQRYWLIVPYIGNLSDIGNLMVPLIPAMWWLLIARVIQAESLVGDRQWWVTRPYERKSLLAAKTLFPLVWLYIPFVLAQMAILRESGLGLLGHASHWYFLLLFISAVVVLPLVAVAAVTSNFARMTLTTVGGIVAVIGFSFLASEHGPTYDSTVPYAHTAYILAVLFLGALLVVALQYATRRAWLSRALLFGVAVLAAGVGLTLAAMRQGEIDRQFPAPSTGATAPIQVAVVPSPSNPWRLYPAERAGMLYLQLPLEFSGVAEGTAVELNDVKFTMDAAGGQQWTAPWWHWTSPWWTTRELHFLSGTYDPGVQIMMSREQYERFKIHPITLQVTLAVTELHAATETSAAVSNGEFRVSGYGVCASPSQWYLHSALICRSEVGQSRLTRVTTTWSQYPCSGPQPEPQDAFTGSDWTGEAYSDPLDHIWNPVALGIVRPDWRRSNGHMVNPQELTFCPGTPVHFTQYAVTRRTRVYLTIPNFQLPELPKGWRNER